MVEPKPQPPLGSLWEQYGNLTGINGLRGKPKGHHCVMQEGIFGAKFVPGKRAGL